MADQSPNTMVFGTVNNGSKITIRTDTSTKVPALTSFDRSGGAVLDSIRSKLVEDPSPNRARVGESNLTPDQGYIDAVSQDTGLSISQARGLLDALPDLELSKQIIVSSILSPNDMISTDLIYGCATQVFGDVTQSLVAVIKDYFDDVYKIKKQLPDIIGKAIFTDGSYALAIFPETAIDAAINSNLKISRESIATLDSDIRNPLWILGNPTDTKPNLTKGPTNLIASFESAHSLIDRGTFNNVVGYDCLYLTVTDNPATVRMPAMLNRIRRSSIVGKYDRRTYSAEYYSNKYTSQSNKNISDNIDHIYPSRITSNVPIIDMSTLEGDSRNVGHPVVFAPQTVIPVFEPGSPSTHVGYFIPLDETGNPLSTAGYQDQFIELQNMARANGQSNGISSGTGSGYANYEAVSSVLSNDQDNAPTNPAEAAKLYGAIIENELSERLKNGDYNEKHTIAKATAVYRMMFTRACQAMGTQLLYVPIEYMTYFAYDYHENGTGRSLLEKTKSISSLRMINLMATSMAAIKGAINQRKVDITLEPEDPNPMKTIEQHIHEFSRATQSEFPIGMLSYGDITDSLQKAGVSVSVSGHPGVPETRMEVSNNNTQYAGAENDLDEKLAKQNIMGFGIPPDSVNSATEMEFDKNVVTYNSLSNKINMVRQDITCEHISDFMRKYTRNSSPLIDKLKEIIAKNRTRLEIGADVKNITDEQLAMLFINYIEIKLPEADTSKVASEMEAFNAYEQALEVFLNAFISDEMMSTELMGEEVGNAVRSMRPVIKAHFLRRYLSDKNIAPELFSLVATGDMENEYFDILEQHEDYIKSIMPAFKKFIIRTMQAGNQGDGVILAAKSILEEIKQARERAGQDIADAGGMVDNEEDTSGEEGEEEDDLFGDEVDGEEEEAEGSEDKDADKKDDDDDEEEDPFEF